MRHELTAAERAEIAAVAVPAEGGVPLDTCLVTVPGGWSVAWMRDGGRRKEAFGRAYSDPIRAAAASAFRRELTFGAAP